MYIYTIYHIYHMPHQESSSLPSGPQPWPSPASLEPPFSPFVKPTCGRNRGGTAPTGLLEEPKTGDWTRLDSPDHEKWWKMVVQYFQHGFLGINTWAIHPRKKTFRTWWLNQRIDFRVPGEAGWRWPTVIESILIQWTPILGTFLQ